MEFLDPTIYWEENPRIFAVHIQIWLTSKHVAKFAGVRFDDLRVNMPTI